MKFSVLFPMYLPEDNFHVERDQPLLRRCFVKPTVEWKEASGPGGKLGKKVPGCKLKKITRRQS